MIRIALIDDHVALRDALGLALSDHTDLTVVGEASDASTGLALLESTRPDVALVDISMPGDDGLRLVSVARQQTQTKLIVLTMFAKQAKAWEAFAAGAVGFASKTQPLDELVSAIRIVTGGDRYAPPGFSMDHRRPFGARPLGTTALSRREREILDLVVAGKLTREIATDLFISVKTVETHRASINRKLGVHSVGELMRFAATHGLLPS